MRPGSILADPKVNQDNDPPNPRRTLCRRSNNPRSGCQRKAWGVSPRKVVKRVASPRSGRQPGIVATIARFAGSIGVVALVLGLAPQALCWRPLRGLTHTLNAIIQR